MTIANNFLFKISKAQQICFVVADLDAWMERLWTVFGMGPWKVNYRDPYAKEDCTWIKDTTYMGNPAHFTYKLASTTFENGMIYELIQPLTGDSTFSKFLKEHGEGVHHIGWHIVNSDDEYLKVCKMLEDNGFPCEQSSRIFRSKMGYYDTTSVLGTMLEVAYEDPTKQRPEPLYMYPPEK
jgi:methylmalonyl-CoA/ethylmalonyl-CoA epimerase